MIDMDSMFVGIGKLGGCLNVSARNGKIFLDKKKSHLRGMRPFPLNKRYAVHKNGYIFDSTENFRHIDRVKIGDDLFVNLIFEESESAIPFMVAEIILITFKPGYQIGDDFYLKGESSSLGVKKVRAVPGRKPTNYEQLELEKWNCQNKADYANTRVLSIRPTDSSITPTDVYECLIRSEFKCFYCGDSISGKNWHLDHVIPVSKGGKNSRLNITPACAECNLMKHSLMLERFIEQVGKIFANFKK